MAVTTAAVIGIVATVGSTVMSFDQASKQKKAQRDAERDADEALANAKKKLDTNFYAAQGIKKEPYELEREALLSQGAMAIQAGVESERGAAATAGRVQLAQQQGQAAVRSAMGQELTNLENKQLAEESRLSDIGVQLDLGEVEGAQLAAANAERLKAQAQQQGIQGVVSAAGQVAAALPLFSGDKADVSGVSAIPDASFNKTIGSNYGNFGNKLPFNLNSYPIQTTNINQAAPSITPTATNITPTNQGVDPFLPLYLQRQQNIRSYNPYTYNDPFNIYGKSN
jgi:hypothetical protein